MLRILDKAYNFRKNRDNFIMILDGKCQKTSHRGPVFTKMSEELVLQWSMQTGQRGGREPEARAPFVI